MIAARVCPTTSATHELCFKSLNHVGRTLSFPCDAVGQVAMDELSERGRNNYLFARGVIGRDYGVPVVIPTRDTQ